MAFRLNEFLDLQSTAKKFSDGMVICRPILVAGADHIKETLMQANEYWVRNEELARSRSMDLLMRITCKEQISQAVASSGITSADSIVLFGVTKDESEIQRAVDLILEAAVNAERDDGLLEMNRQKFLFLKKFHALPKWLNVDQVFVALKEKSVLLIFDN
ncbi:MAG: hypothetical protein JRN20_16315 [Nitrososphaerota archaeon]|nr:hypothetical protein [Nitrososphaerota archaeon]